MSSQVPNHGKGGSNASKNGESPRPPTYSDKETPSTSSSSGSSRNPPLKVDKDTKLLVLPGYRNEGEYFFTTEAGPSNDGIYSVRSDGHPSGKYFYTAGQLALPIETFGHLMLANSNRQASLKAWDNRQEELLRKLKASESRVNTLEVEKRQYLESDAGGHDYNLPFPSQNELIKRVKSFRKEFVVSMMNKVAHFEHSVIKHMLVSTVKQCHDLAQRHVKERLKELDIFLLGNDRAGNSHFANMSAYANDIAGRAFKKVHQYMFGQFYPSEGTSSVLLGEVKEEVVKSATSSIHASMTSFIRTGGEAYEVCIMKLLQTFLECELTRPTPLKFSDSFGAKEHWDNSLHIDVHAPRVETEGKTDVQVILPGLYLAEGANETKPEQFVTKPVVICCESSASAGGDESMTD